jgi:transcriptional regulator GlxA family with amidase domain
MPVTRAWSEAREIIAGLPATLPRAERLFVGQLVTQLVAKLTPPGVASSVGGRRVLDFLALDSSSHTWQVQALQLLEDAAAMTDRRGRLPVVPPLVRWVLRAIDDRYATPLTLTRLAHELDVSRAHLSHLLTHVTGKSFAEHLHDRRTAIAQERLTTTRMSIKQVAALAGYTSHARFRCQYVRRYGVTPASTRAQHLANRSARLATVQNDLK